MDAPAPQPSQRRVRASEKAVTAALRAIRNAGLPVDRLSVSGGQVEIHISGIEPEPASQNDDGLKDW
ncbi:hypothetical protein NAC44_08000 [Allorhizobium sp. BGMRC 0089]|uniref:hypothetical protein n=1 Tax=Allorhizobium sonneratiae TaxID=2934936 RepID=UPI0020344DE0|nr:hypothetical protein [Allorhizobium sonneratiae]MCM2292268.1 hypothetical protein [Allorhizobium sonneratiae]